MANYRLFPATDGPADTVSYTGSFIAAVVFEATADNCWFDGYWWWVAPTGGLTAPQTFALWLATSGSAGILLPAATVVSGALSPGWNWVPLATPIMLPIGGNVGTGGANFVACTGVNGNFPTTNAQFGVGDAYAAGITNGPLTAFSDQGASNPGPFSLGQGLFSTSGSDPTAAMPLQAFESANFWLDVQVSDTPPTGYAGSYRLWPNFPNVTNGIPVAIDTFTQTMGTQFSLSQSCTLDNVWLYSPLGVSGLPASTQIWNADTGALVPGTNLAAAWSGAAGSGWIANAYAGAGIVLPAGSYIATVFNDSGQEFYLETRGYFGAYEGVTGPGASGLINGPLSSPSNATAINPPGGNSCYFYGGDTPTFPNAWDTNDGGENRWVDIEVTPAGMTGPPPPTRNSGAFLVLFP